jgi:hypothetical protein
MMDEPRFDNKGNLFYRSVGLAKAEYDACLALIVKPGDIVVGTKYVQIYCYDSRSIGAYQFHVIGTGLDKEFGEEYFLIHRWIRDEEYREYFIVFTAGKGPYLYGKDWGILTLTDFHKTIKE